MHRQWLYSAIDQYQHSILPHWVQAGVSSESTELEILVRFKDFVSQHEDCFKRDCKPGHITGSALVVSPDYRRVVLTHHKKLEKWLQLGGHSDGDELTWRVAMREAEEESGLKQLAMAEFYNQFGPFDFDIHYIPAHGQDPAHYHYDVRFLIVAQDTELAISEESKALEWFTIDDARKLTKAEDSMLRQFDKLDRLRELLS